MDYSRGVGGGERRVALQELMPDVRTCLAHQRRLRTCLLERGLPALAFSNDFFVFLFSIVEYHYVHHHAVPLCFLPCLRFICCRIYSLRSKVRSVIILRLLPVLCNGNIGLPCHSRSSTEAYLYGTCSFLTCCLTGSTLDGDLYFNSVAID